MGSALTAEQLRLTLQPRDSTTLNTDTQNPSAVYHESQVTDFLQPRKEDTKKNQGIAYQLSYYCCGFFCSSSRSWRDYASSSYSVCCFIIVQRLEVTTARAAVSALPTVLGFCRCACRQNGAKHYECSPRLAGTSSRPGLLRCALNPVLSVTAPMMSRRQCLLSCVRVVLLRRSVSAHGHGNAELRMVATRPCGWRLSLLKTL